MPEGIRILSAIMFTDLVGYTALMQENEEKAVQIRNRHRKILQELIPFHQGRIMQYFGDGTLSIFGSAAEAVKCAVKIQKALMEEPPIPLRIGLHMGDIVYDDEGVYGDSVNIASRIESMAVPGSILVSDKINDEIKNQPLLTAVSLGTFEFKNVKRPMEVFALSSEGIIIPAPEEIRGKGARLMRSIAVLPFVNMSADPENEYFSDGITEEIINALTKVEHLQVTSRTSSFAFKGRLQDIREIGNRLNVAAVLEGSVRRAHDKVRITAQLINIADGYHYWSEVFDRRLEDIFEVQDEISQKIRDRLLEDFSGAGPKEKLVNVQTGNIDAYNFYLKGLYHFNKFNPESFAKAISYYEEAVKLEPKYSMAYGGLAACYIITATYGLSDPEVSYKKSEEYAKKAIEYDEQNFTGYIAMGMVRLFNYWDWDGAAENFETAGRLNPQSREVPYFLSLLASIRGNYGEALDYAEKAFRMDPLSLLCIERLANSYFYLGDYKKAEEYFDKILELDPHFRSALVGLAHLKCAIGEYDEALKILNERQKMLNDELKGASELGLVYALAGMKDEAYACIQKLRQREQRDKHVSLTIDYATVYSALKEYDKAFDYFEEAYEKRHGSVIFIKHYPKMFGLPKDHPRFLELLRKLKLSD